MGALSSVDSFSPCQPEPAPKQASSCCTINRSSREGVTDIDLRSHGYQPAGDADEQSWVGLKGLSSSDFFPEDICSMPKLARDVAIDGKAVRVISRTKHFASCGVCKQAFASHVELACGHVGYCHWCSRGPCAVLKNQCVVCGQDSAERIDISKSLHPETGQPSQCDVCEERFAEVLAVPCGCFRRCRNCFGDTTQRGCHACGAKLESIVLVSWDIFVSERNRGNQAHSNWGKQGSDYGQGKGGGKSGVRDRL